MSRLIWICSVSNSAIVVFGALRVKKVPGLEVGLLVSDTKFHTYERKVKYGFSSQEPIFK